MLYDIIYDFFFDLFNSNNLNVYEMDIMNVSTTFPSWLAHTATIVLMGLGVLWLILVVRWIFRVFAGLIKV